MTDSWPLTGSGFHVVVRSGDFPSAAPRTLLMRGDHRCRRRRTGRSLRQPRPRPTKHLPLIRCRPCTIESRQSRENSRNSSSRRVLLDHREVADQLVHKARPVQAEPKATRVRLVRLVRLVRRGRKAGKVRPDRPVPRGQPGRKGHLGPRVIRLRPPDRLAQRNCHPPGQAWACWPTLPCSSCHRGSRTGSAAGGASIAGAAGTAARGDPSDSAVARSLDRVARLLVTGPCT